MSDILLVVLTLAFFALAALLVRWCDHIIGPDSDSDGLDDGVVVAEGVDELVGAES